MSLSTEMTEAQRKFADAAKAMQKIGNEAREKPPEEMPEAFREAQADLEAAQKVINRLKAVDVAAAAADAAVSQAMEPVGVPPLNAAGGEGGPNGGNGNGQVLPMAELREAYAMDSARLPGRPRGRNYYREVDRGISARDHSQAFDTYARGGYNTFQAAYGHLAPDVRNALMTSSGELGGFWVPPDFRREMITDLAAQSILFRLARIVPTTTNEATWPTMLSDPTSPRIYRSGFRGAWRAEYETGAPGSTMATQNQPRAGLKNIPVHIWQPDAILITPEQMEDSAFNMEAVCADVITETLSLEMDSLGLVSGTGSQEPTGILVSLNAISGTPNRVTATAAASIDYNAWIDLVFGAAGLPSQYRQGAAIVMNTATYAATLKLNDGVDRPLINVFTTPDRIYGYPIEFSEFLAVPASSADVAIFGNFTNYAIGERTDLRIMRYDQTHPPNITLLARARYGGDVLRPAGFRTLRCGA